MPSVLQFQPFAAWTANSEWTQQLPLDESIQGVALGDCWVAAVTSKKLLRLFSHAGLQRQLFRLPGTPVCVAGRQNLCAVVSHGGPAYHGPDGSVEQHLVLTLVEISPQGTINLRVRAERLPLSPNSTLTWLGFTEGGALAAVDSKGTLQILARGWENVWSPMLDLPTAASKVPGAQSGCGLWVVGLLDDKAVCAMLRPGEKEPSLLSKQPLTSVNYAMPLLQPESSITTLEENLLRTSALRPISDDANDIQFDLKQDTAILGLGELLPSSLRRGIRSAHEMFFFLSSTSL